MAKMEGVPMNRVAVTSCVICVGAGAVLSAAIHHSAPLVAGACIGLYLLFSIKVVQQWEKVALLRLGKYAGLRGPGWFHMVPVFETISAHIDQRVRVHSVYRGIDTDTRYCSGECGRDCILAGLECGEVDSGG